MAKNEKNQEAQAASADDPVVAAPQPDASAYVLQPTSERLNIEVVGEIPPGRFMEEVARGSDEEDSSTESWDAHPPENRPAYGVTAEGQPDTSGRRRR